MIGTSHLRREVDDGRSALLVAVLLAGFVVAQRWWFVGLTVVTLLTIVGCQILARSVFRRRRRTAAPTGRLTYRLRLHEGRIQLLGEGTGRWHGEYSSVPVDLHVAPGGLEVEPPAPTRYATGYGGSRIGWGELVSVTEQDAGRLRPDGTFCFLRQTLVTMLLTGVGGRPGVVAATFTTDAADDLVERLRARATGRLPA